MGRKPKTPQYDEFNEQPNAFGPQTSNTKTWQEVLDVGVPLTLELGCGKAEVSIGLAQKYPYENFIGVDLKADRLVKAARRAKASKLINIAFIQDNILNLETYFRENSVSKIWITFPDPFLKDRQQKHRMFNQNFLEIYKRILSPDSFIFFKTDNQQLFRWVQEILDAQADISVDRVEADLHQSDLGEDFKIVTTFEQRFLDRQQPIFFLQFRFN